MRTSSSTSVRGFSLIELLVVIGIIGLLSAIIYPNVGGSRAKARDAQRVSDLGQLQLALRFYYDRCEQYPATLSTSANTGCPSGITLGTFINTIPTPPSGAGQSSYEYAGQISSSKYVNYILHATLESYNAAMSRSFSTTGGMPAGSWTQSSISCNNNTSSPFEYCVSSI